ncbi:MAG: DUF4280 domain-containing protein [Segatella salivae]
MKTKGNKIDTENRRQHDEEERRKWKDPNENEKFVCDGATVLCPYCSAPKGKLVVKGPRVKLQDKPWANAGDNNGLANFAFNGLCMHPKWGNQKPPCNAVISLGLWKKLSDVNVDGFKGLLVKSTIPCHVSGECIKIVHSGQTARLDVKKRPRVCAIMVDESLEEGYNYDGESSELVSGFVYNKIYHLTAIIHNDNGVKDEDIHWEAEYVFTNGYRTKVKNRTLDRIWTDKGRHITLPPMLPSLIGGTLVFYAYINKPKGEATWTIWVHYRFRFFNFKQVQDQIIQRVGKPWLIDQSGTSLCGMACLFYVFAKLHPVEYGKFIIDMHHKGEASFNGYTVRPDEDAAEEMYNMDPAGNNYPVWTDANGKVVKRMPMADWLSLAVLRSHESTTWIKPIVLNPFPPIVIPVPKKMIYKGKREDTMDQLAAVNWPGMMERLCREFLGFQNVESTLSMELMKEQKHFFRGWLSDKMSDRDLRSLEDMEQAHKDGATVLMMIDSQMFDDIVSYSYNDLLTKSHWIVYEGGLTFYDAANKPVEDIDKATKLVFKFATWGVAPSNSHENLVNKKNISVSCFKSTFYGFITCRDYLPSNKKIIDSYMKA